MSHGFFSVWLGCIVLVASFSFTEGTQDHPQDKRNVTAMDAVVYANNKQGNVYCSNTTTRNKTVVSFINYKAPSLTNIVRGFIVMTLGSHSTDVLR
jgi:hypothetical protein